MWERLIRLEVPFYHQHYEFTCGPASLMMAMKHFDREMPLSRDLEVDIWREASMVEVYGTSRYGLAYSAAVRGFGAKVFSNLASFGFVDKLEPRVENINRRLLELFFQERRRRCLELGVKEQKAAISTDVLRAELASDSVPLLLTNAIHFSDEDIPHWVVVTGMDDRMAYFNNPLADRANEAFPLGTFNTILGYKGHQCAVSISGR